MQNQATREEGERWLEKYRAMNEFEIARGPHSYATIYGKTIRYQHGHITILDRAGLENATCECYEAVAAEYRALFGE